MKKILPIVLAFLIGAAAGMLFITPGFQKRTDVYLQKFSVSDDGSIVTDVSRGFHGLHPGHGGQAVRR